MQKISKYTTLGALSLATALSLSNCKEQFSKKEAVSLLEENLLTDEIKDSIEVSLEIRQDLENYAKSLSNELVNVSYYGKSQKKLMIMGGNVAAKNKRLSDSFYEQLNLVIKEGNVQELNFLFLDNTFDFSKIDFSNIENLSIDHFNGVLDSSRGNFSNLKRLVLENINGEFDCSAFNQKLKDIRFSNNSLDIAKKILSSCNVSNAEFYWIDDQYEEKNNLKELLKFLVDNSISIKSFNVYQSNKKNSSGITSEEFSLLSKLNTNSIKIDGAGFKNTINLDLTLNEKISSFSLLAYNKDYDFNKTNGELGNIKIKSNNKQLHLNFIHVDITDNTSFSFPNNSYVSLHSLNCTSIQAFYDLANVEYLCFKEDLGYGPESDLEGAIYYCSNLNCFQFSKAEFYRDYNKVLKDLECYSKLKKIKEKLNISEKHSKDILNIGDTVNLNDPNVSVFESGKSLENNQNVKTSLYGTSIFRCIRSIIMTKEDIVIEVDNMEDYKLFLSIGYVVIGYNLVNQYSLNEDGTLTDEFTCNDEDVKLVHTPFK